MQAMYFGYLGVGPWAAVRFLEGEPLGIYQLGRVLYFLQGKPHYVHSVDTSIGVVIHMILTLGPLTLVFASTASRQDMLPKSLNPRFHRYFRELHVLLRPCTNVCVWSGALMWMI
jgi:hypothetical protein